MPFVKAIAKSELKPNQGRCVTLEGKQIAIFNMDGQYLAIDDLCTHADASLADGGAFKDEQGRCMVECPWHGARFDLKTGAAKWTLSLAKETGAAGMVYGGITAHGGRLIVATCNLEGPFAGKETAVACIGSK